MTSDDIAILQIASVTASALAVLIGAFLAIHFTRPL